MLNTMLLAFAVSSSVLPTLYRHPCGNGDPIFRPCPNGYVDVPSQTYPTCASLGLQVGDVCTPGLERCVLTEAQACIENPELATRSAEYLWCRTEPFDLDYPCPISTREAKQDIAYLTEDAQAELAAHVLKLKLATYEYKEGVPGMPGQQLGFILEDAAGAPFVMQDIKKVNMYSYVSALVATVQKQQKEIEELRQLVKAAPR